MVQFGVVRLSPWAAPVRVAVPVTIALAPVALWAYRGRLGVWVIFVGLAANLCVIVANGGLMPMERSTLVSALGAEHADAYMTGAWISGSKDVLVERGEGQLVALGDSIIVRVGGGGFVASPVTCCDLVGAADPGGGGVDRVAACIAESDAGRASRGDATGGGRRNHATVTRHPATNRSLRQRGQIRHKPQQLIVRANSDQALTGFSRF